MSRLQRVLYVAGLDPSMKFGSLEEQVLEFAKAARDRGSLFLPLYAAALGGATRDRYAAEGFLAEALDLWNFDLAKARVLTGIVRRHRIEALQWNFYDALSPYLAWLSLTCPRVGHVFISHSSRANEAVERRSLLKRTAKRTALRRYRAVLGVSDFVVGCLEEEGWWPRVGRFWHFVNTGRFRPSLEERVRMRAEYAVEDRFLVVAVAHLIREKGIQTLLAAAARMPDATRFWIIGEGPYRPALEEMTREFGLEERVQFLGSQWFVEPFLQAADVSVCPSLWAEAAGLVVLEALACGLPVVGSATGGIPEFVRDGENGVLVPPGDAPALSRALLRLLGDPDLRERLASRARADAVARYGIEENVARNLRLYEIPGGRSRS